MGTGRAGDYDNDGTRTCSSPSSGPTACSATGRRTETSPNGRLDTVRSRWGRLRVPFDYDRNGLDIFAPIISIPIGRRRPCPKPGLCRWGDCPSPAARRACRAARTSSIATGRRTFADAPAVRHVRANGTYALASTLDFDDDGGIYVANDSNLERSIEQSRRHADRHRCDCRPCLHRRLPQWKRASPLATTTTTADGHLKTTCRRHLDTLRTTERLCEDRTFASGFRAHTRWLDGPSCSGFDPTAGTFLVNGTSIPRWIRSRPRPAQTAQGGVSQSRDGGSTTTEQLGPPSLCPRSPRCGLC